MNAEHVHVLLDLPASLSLEECVKLVKGASSHWINQERIVPGRFRWARGYAAFSVSESNVPTIVRYIASQAEHHRIKTFGDEFDAVARRHGLQCQTEGLDQSSSDR